MTQPNDDMPALESWLREKALEAHNTWCIDCEFLKACPANDEDTCRDGILCALDAKEKAFNETIAKIQSGRVNQRPHFDYEGREFDVR